MNDFYIGIVLSTYKLTLMKKADIVFQLKNNTYISWHHFGIFTNFNNKFVADQSTLSAHTVAI